MQVSRKSLAFLLSTTLLAACGPEVTNSSASNNATAMDNGMAINGMAADPSNPFAQSEMDMDRKMMAAIGVNAADTWTAKMIEHHQGAVDMSRTILQHSPRPAVARLAQETIDRQSKEIEELRGMRQQGSPNPSSGEPYRPAMMTMHQAMMAAKGSDVSETYLRKMLEHHKGAVAMSDVALSSGVTGALRSVIEKTRTDQLKEIAAIEAMLRGDRPPEAASTTAAPRQDASKSLARPAASAPSKPAASSSGATAAKSQDASTPATKPAPATSNTSSSCTAEHRAMGHC